MAPHWNCCGATRRAPDSIGALRIVRSVRIPSARTAVAVGNTLKPPCVTVSYGTRSFRCHTARQGTRDASLDGEQPPRPSFALAVLYLLLRYAPTPDVRSACDILLTMRARLLSAWMLPMGSPNVYDPSDDIRHRLLRSGGAGPPSIRKRLRIPSATIGNRHGCDSLRARSLNIHGLRSRTNLCRQAT